MRVYLDSCVVIYLVEEVDPWWTRVSRALRDGLPEITVSDLVRMECLVLPIRQRRTELQMSYRESLRLYEHILSSAVFDFAANLRAEHRLRTPDALHIADAITSGCDEFWNDHRLDRLDLSLAVRVFSDES